MNLNKKFVSVLVVFCLFVIAWIIVLQLTQQRIQLEAKNKMKAVTTNQTPFNWKFETFNTDIVTPYQKYWKVQKSDSTIYAEKDSNPVLSLNFSGEKVNTDHYNTLQLKSSIKLHGTLKLQIKVSHEDGMFYYSNPIKLSGNDQVISLEQEWTGVDENNNKVNDFKWPGIKNHISSLVLQFTNPEDILFLSSVKLPYVSRTGGIRELVYIDCKGDYGTHFQPEAIDYNFFVLNEPCWLPSNYMWLKDFIGNNFPGAFFMIDNTELIMDVSVHKVNKNYSKNILINSIFYTLVVFFIVLVYYLSNSNRQVAHVFKKNKIYGWVTTYTVILGVSLILLIVMSWFKFPDVSTFKLFPMYFLWAIVQQLILGYVLAEKFFYKKTQNKFLSSLFAATIFSLFHLPSITLVIVTFIAGYCWSYAWLTFKRIIPLAISHTLLALMFYYVISSRILYSARVFHWFWE